MRDTDMRQTGVRGSTHSALTLNAALSQEAARSYDADQQRKGSGESDPIRGLRNGLIISAAMWTILYVIAQLILR